MTRRTLIPTLALIMTLTVLATIAGACGGSSGDLSVLDGSSPPVAESTAASASPTISATPTETVTPTPTDDAGSDTTAGAVSADEFAAYVEGVKPWYDEITSVEAAIINAIAEVEEMQISPGQGGRRIERLGWKLDPPVVELASMDVPPALEAAHTAWLDGISFEAQAFALLYEQMKSGTYQRGSSDPEYEQLFEQASAKWDEWRLAVQQYEQETGVDVPWLWAGE